MNPLFLIAILAGVAVWLSLRSNWLLGGLAPLLGLAAFGLLYFGPKLLEMYAKAAVAPFLKPRRPT